MARESACNKTCIIIRREATEIIMAIITLSRKVGSWGETISRLVAEKLGYRIVTPQDFHRLAEECDSNFKRACRLFETELPGGLVERFFLREPAYASLFQALNFGACCRGGRRYLGPGRSESYSPTIQGSSASALWLPLIFG